MGKTVPESQIKTIQLTQGMKRYDTTGRELRHASQLWHEAFRCWHRYKQHECGYSWDEAKVSDFNMCYWCDRDEFVRERNGKAETDGIRWIPPKKISSFHTAVNSKKPGAVHMSFVHAKMMRRCK